MESTVYKATYSAKTILLLYPVVMLIVYLLYRFAGKENWYILIFLTVYTLFMLLAFLRKYKITSDGFLKGYAGYGLIRIFTIPIAQITELQSEKNGELTVKYQKTDFLHPSSRIVALQGKSKSQFVEDITRIRPGIIVTPWVKR